VSDLDTAVLGHALHSLVEAELLYQRGVPPQASYTFKHALIQETAYQSLLRSTRVEHHRKIADVLGAQFPDIVDSQPELVAHHYAAAALEPSAIPYWLAAGRRNNARSAYAEAIIHLNRGLGALRSLPESADRLQREVEFCTLLGPAMIALKGYGSPDVVRLYDQAQELCNRLGDPPQLFPILYGLTRARYNRAELDMASGLGARLLRVAEATPEPTLLVAAHTILGAIEVSIGRLEVARAHLETANALYDRRHHDDLIARFATDNGIVSGNFTIWALWCLGYPDRALRKGIENTSLAEELAHPLTLAMTYCFRAVAHQYRRERDAVRKWAEAAMAISSKHGFPQWLGMGMLLEGWAKEDETNTHQHHRQMVDGLALWRSAGAECFVPYGLSLLGEACEQEHQQEQGLRTVDAALEQVERTDERHWEAELHRIRGNLILLKATGDAEDRAETCFHRALGVSRRQQAKSLELRAAVSLADLWRRQGKSAKAHDLLAPIHGWFSEGFDTADLQAARALLEELNPRDTTA